MEISVQEFPVVASGRAIVDTYVEQVAQLRAEGFRRIWSAQMPYERDLLTAMTIAFRDVGDIELGTAVLPIQNQHPMLLAQRALTLNLVADGRFNLGLRMTHRLVTEGMWGIPWDKPIRRLGEYLDGLLPLLDGEPADATGETVTTRGSLQIPGAAAPPVYVAALGPQMLRLTGRRAAGTLTWMTGPKTTAEHVGPTMREAAAEAGRPVGAVRVISALPVSVTDDIDGTRKLAAEVFSYAPPGWTSSSARRSTPRRRAGPAPGRYCATGRTNTDSPSRPAHQIDRRAAHLVD